MLLDVLDVLSRFCIFAVERRLFDVGMCGAVGRAGASSPRPLRLLSGFRPHPAYPCTALASAGVSARRLRRTVVVRAKNISVTSVCVPCLALMPCRRGGWLRLPSVFLVLPLFGWRCVRSLGCRLCCCFVSVPRFVFRLSLFQKLSELRA